MCELLGMSANIPADIRFSLTGLMQRGGITAQHTDGWGISFYEKKACRHFVDDRPIAHSPIARFIKSYPIKSPLIISHIRKANRGCVCVQNTHPFLRELWGRQWSYAHNGQLKGIKKLKLKRFRPVGTTDSEHAFCWLMEQIAERFSDSPKRNETLWQFINDKCCYLAEFGAFNMLLADAKHLYAFCSTKLVYLERRTPFSHAKLKDVELTMNFQHINDENDQFIIVATEALTHNETWHRLGRHDLLVLSEGKILRHFSG